MGPVKKMNERIDKLMVKAGAYFGGEGVEYSNFDPKKFAELIVAECLSIVKSNTHGPAGEYDYSYTDENAAADDRAETIYKDITYRFGVEE